MHALSVLYPFKHSEFFSEALFYVFLIYLWNTHKIMVQQTGRSDELCEVQTGVQKHLMKALY